MRITPSQRRRIVLPSLFCSVLGLSFLGIHAYLQNPNRGLPYRDSFASGYADEWKALGGTWELVSGAMRNDSDERGAKLMTGSPHWQNYSIEADISLLGAGGDAGLMIRSGNEEEGVNAYDGYYAGIRTIDNSLVVGRAEHGWLEANRKNPTPDEIRPFVWYHLKLLAYECQIVAAVNTPKQTTPTSLAITDQDCVRSGRVGLRSYSSGGVWRDVSVRTATQQDLLEMLKGAKGETNSEPRNAPLVDSEFPWQRVRINQDNTNAVVQSIASLRLTAFAKPATATVRGVVILTAPLLFVEDSTGGIYVPHPNAPVLKVGDEVEVNGEAIPGDFSSTMENAAVHVLWARTPMPPVSVTASQASTGKFDATFIEVQGRLVAKEHGPDNTLILDLDEGPQSFRAMMNPGRSDYLFGKLKLNSSLRLRGICVIDPVFTHNLNAFVLLLPSNEDLEVLAGPPWWSTGHIIAIVFAALLLALIANFVYHRIAHWRLQGVLEERQRMAHEMHDTLAQSFAGIGFQLQAIRNGLTVESSNVIQQLDLASTLVRHSHEEARRSIATLRPESMESQDLLSALGLCARRMVEGGAVEVVAKKFGSVRPIPLRIADTLFRIGQEAVANAVRHAHPTKLTIQLSYIDDSVQLIVEDNGIGFVQTNGLKGFGIRGMRKRAQSISATFKVDSRQSEGTRVQVSVQLPPRITLTTWPKLFWRFIKEHGFDGRPSKHADSRPYR